MPASQQTRLQRSQIAELPVHAIRLVGVVIPFSFGLVKKEHLVEALKSDAEYL